jgi:hypothetical protein
MRRTLPLLAAILITLNLAQAQEIETSPASTDYEELPVLKASEILRENILNGPYHKVGEEVPTSSGANRFSIDSQFGVFEVEGNEMLVRRVGEINAIAKLKEVSRTAQFKDALVTAAKSPVAAAKQIVTDPVGTISNAPKGIMKFMNRAGQTIKGIGKKQDTDHYQGSQMQQTIGFSSAKRKVAISLGVDPYSSNAVLQRELEGIAWASFAGNATFSLGTLPIGGGVGAALAVTSTQGKLEDILRDKSPAELKTINRKALVTIGATGQAADRFLANDAFSPTAQTAMVLNLKSLAGVQNRGAFIRLAGAMSTTEEDAIFWVQTAALMNKLHNGSMPLAKMALIGDFPICIAKDGTVAIALQWDYAAWTPTAERFLESVQAAQPESNSSYLVALSGVVSPRLRQELESRHYRVEDRLSPGPLK